MTITASNRGPLSRGYDLIAVTFTSNCSNSGSFREPAEAFDSTYFITSSGILAFGIHGSDIGGSFGFHHYNLPAFLYIFSSFCLICLASEHLSFEKESLISTHPPAGSQAFMLSHHGWTRWTPDRIYKARAGPRKTYLRLVFIFPSKNKKVHAAMHPHHLPKKRPGQAYSDSWIPKTFFCLFFPCLVSLPFFYIWV